MYSGHFSQEFYHFGLTLTVLASWRRTPEERSSRLLLPSTAAFEVEPPSNQHHSLSVI